MLQTGDKVKYRDLVGEVRSVLDDMIIVKLPDGKEYSLPYDSVTTEGSTVMAPSSMQGIMSALRPFIKNMNFLNDLAQMMNQAGISELHIKGGSIQAFSSKESYEEKLARYKAEAIIAAEQKAKDEYAQESASNTNALI